MAHPANQPKGIQYGSMPGDEHIKKMPQSGQGLVLGGTVAGDLVDEAAGQARRDPGELRDPGLGKPTRELISVSNGRMA
jgi:hypothetical protein